MLEAADVAVQLLVCRDFGDSPKGCRTNIRNCVCVLGNGLALDESRQTVAGVANVADRSKLLKEGFLESVPGGDECPGCGCADVRLPPECSGASKESGDIDDAIRILDA